MITAIITITLNRLFPERCLPMNVSQKMKIKAQRSDQLLASLLTARSILKLLLLNLPGRDPFLKLSHNTSRPGTNL